MDYSILDFYHIRLELLLRNPLEILYLVSAPVVILCSLIRPKKLFYFLILLPIYSLAAWPLSVAAMFKHYDLISEMIKSVQNPPPELVSMMDGDGPKMIFGIIFGGAFSGMYYLLWCLLLSPVLYFRLKDFRSSRLENVSKQSANNGNI
jgi:hypothetical protein